MVCNRVKTVGLPIAAWEIDAYTPLLCQRPLSRPIALARGRVSDRPSPGRATKESDLRVLLGGRCPSRTLHLPSELWKRRRCPPRNLHLFNSPDAHAPQVNQEFALRIEDSRSDVFLGFVCTLGHGRNTCAHVNILWDSRVRWAKGATPVHVIESSLVRVHAGPWAQPVHTFQHRLGGYFVPFPLPSFYGCVLPRARLQSSYF